MTTLRTTAGVAFRFPGWTPREPAKSIPARSPSMERLHVTRDRSRAVRGSERAQRLGPRVVGRHRGAQVGQVVVDGAGRIGRGLQETPHLVPARRAAPHQVGWGDHHALFREARGRRRHRARAGAADLRVVRAARHVADQEGRRPGAGGSSGPARGRREHRRHDGHVGQVGPAVSGMVGHQDVARLHRQRVAQPAYAQAETAQVDGNVRRVHHQLAPSVEEGAGEIQPLLDVGRDGGPPQALAHFHGDRPEAVGEQLEADRLGSRARGRPSRRRGAAQDERAGGVERGGPAGLDGDGAVRLDDQGRAVQAGARREAPALEHRGVDPAAPEMGPPRDRGGRAGGYPLGSADGSRRGSTGRDGRGGA